MNKIITLTLNPAFDKHCFTEHFAPFHENLAEITAFDAGGKGVNISRALSANGINNTSLVVLGEENAEDFRAQLKKDGLSFIEITVPGRIRENITLHTSGADETRISFAGFTADKGLLQTVKEKLLSYITPGDFITLTGRLPDGMPMEAVQSFIAEIKEAGAKTVIDSRSFCYSDLICAKPYLIKPNSEEVSAFLGQKAETREEMIGAAQAICRKGIENIIISMGADGAVLVCPQGVFSCSAPQISAVSTIGAGDSMIAGFLSAAAENLSPADSLRRAVAFGSAACLSEGTKPPRPDDVAKLLSQIK